MNVLKIKTIHKAEKPKTIHSWKRQKLEKKILKTVGKKGAIPSLSGKRSCLP